MRQTTRSSAASAARPHNTAGISIAPPSYQVDMADQETAQADDAPVQGVFGKPAQQIPPANPNNTGLPDQLKNGIEQLSGYSMDDVQVHYNSPKPATLQAHAYAQGTAIHIAPGQEKHLPHEAWHVVQQKQGRVKPTLQMKGGVNVNDDKGLEKEAAVMGGRAFRIAQSHQVTTNSAPTGIKPLLSPVIQRTIFRYTNSKWEIFEKGTEGKFPKPDSGNEGDFYNDVTGKQNPKIENVRAGLVDLMAVTGSVQEMESIRGNWGDLAKALESEAGDEALIEIGGVKLSFKGSPSHYSTGGIVGRECKEKELIQRSIDFVLSFMRENKQLDYIERQEWYKSSEFHIEVDINFYNKRQMGSGGLGMHKDTGGDNLFVNIIFNNEKVTPATEWTQDVEEAGKAKREVMEKRLPKEMLGAIGDAKNMLKTGKAKASGLDTIEGGTLPKHSYVSWVDELLWHSTPSLDNRPTFTKNSADDLLKTLNYLDYWSTFEGNRYESPDENGKFYYSNGKESVWEHEIDDYKDSLYEAMVILAEKPDTFLNEFCRRPVGGQKLERSIWDKLYNQSLKPNNGDRRRLEKEITEYLWEGEKKTGLWANELDADERIHKKGKTFVPTSIRGRRRANSDPAILTNVKAAAADVPKRSFFRTWVRVVPSNT